MVAQPHCAPWEGAEGSAQQLLGVMNACLLIRRFVASDYDVVALDVLTNVTAQRYQEQLRSLAPIIVSLMASYEEVQLRNRKRGPRLTDNELLMLYQQQQEFTIYDMRVDTTDLPVDLTVSRLVE
jgi:hypothetical protein